MATIKTISGKIVSCVLICIFAFSITPSIVFHNLFAGHTDSIIQHHHKRSSEFAKAGINCHFDSFVSEKTFINFYSPVSFQPLITGISFLSGLNYTFYSKHHFYAELRGPPVSFHPTII